MKKVILFFSTLAFLVICLGLYTTFTVQSATSDAYTIFTNPGQYADSDMSIVWQTALTNKNSYLIYTKKSDSAWANAKRVEPKMEAISSFVGHTTVENGQEVDQQSYLKCTVNLLDLDSDTEYMYKVGQDVMSDTHYFKTGGANEYSMVVMSDFHTHLTYPSRTPYAMSLIDTIEKKSGSIDFILDAGDTVHIGGCNNFYKRNAEEQNYKDYFWAGALGNHDNRDWANTSATNGIKFFRDTHAYPTNGPAGEEGVCYYFIYSNTLFIMMDSVHTSTSNLSKMQAWAQEAIDNNPTQYIIFVQHYAWFELLNADDDEYNRWSAFFDKNGVDLAITGHHHIYARTDAIKAGAKNDNGTVYVVNASSDNARGRGTFSTGNINEFSSASTLEKKLVSYYWTEGGNTIGGLLVDVRGTGIDLKLYDRNGNKKDSVHIMPKDRDLSLSTAEKQNIGKNLSFLQNASGEQAIVLPDNLYGFVSSCEVYNGTELVKSFNYKNKASRYVSIDFEKSATLNLTVKMNFKDGTSASYPINAKAVQNTNFISNVRYLGNLLSWDVVDTDSQIVKYNLYKNDTYIASSNTNSYLLEKGEFGAKYTVKAIGENGVELDSLDYNCGIIGDVNEDGKVNNDDVKAIQKYINGELELTDGTKSYADVNHDNKITIQDAAYLKLYLNGLLTDYTTIRYTVTFIGINGEVIEEVTVKSGEDATPTYLETYDYNVISWSDDYHSVTSDKTIEAVYVRK